MSGAREGEREGGREGGREKEREGGRERGRSKMYTLVSCGLWCDGKKYIAWLSNVIHVTSLIFVQLHFDISACRFQLAVEVFDYQSAILHLYAAGECAHDYKQMDCKG